MSKNKNLPESKDCRCPNCGRLIVYGEKGTFISSTEKEFIHLPDPHFIWQETHKCNMCETMFIVKNGT